MSPTVDRIFRSKIDRWLVILTVVSAFPGLIAVAGVIWSCGLGLTALFTLTVVLLVYALIYGMFRSTYYFFDGSTLVIRSSFFRWRVPINDIVSITPTNNIASGPALSLDRLNIKRKKGWPIMISPLEREEFLAELVRRGGPALSGNA
ncbi:MAG: PH domain-containing protein [Deltaproteobacteria bacterium]|nr:PH domain-containing protein [Deltaproteobacteria bacterium]